MEISPERCARFEGDARDTNLMGEAWAGPASCCESDFGFDPELARRSCDFGRYLGESEELACVHRFEDREGRLVELRVTPIVGLEHDAAVELHERGVFADAHVAGPVPTLDEVWLSSSEDRHWALIGGWPTTRRLTWLDDACSPAAMQPVLAAMAGAGVDELAVTPLPRLASTGADDVETPAPTSLLGRYASPEPSGPGLYPLPRAAAALVDEAMRAAASADLEALVSILEPSARWGLPDRRQLSGRPVLDDGGVELMAALRSVTARMDGELSLHCPQLDRRVMPTIRRGEELMWCVWTSDDRLDMLVFGLRGHIEAGSADATIDYIGLFPERPRGLVSVPAEPPPPPLAPTPNIVCSDPHAASYPELCPEPEPEPEPLLGEGDSLDPSN